MAERPKVAIITSMCVEIINYQIILGEDFEHGPQTNREKLQIVYPTSAWHGSDLMSGSLAAA
jgi:hypothetical protein